MKEMTIRLSAGTAAVAGLRTLRQDIKPTTAYLLIGEECQGQCAFCPQGQASQGTSDFVSRIIWPRFHLPAATAALKKAVHRGSFDRLCLQVTQGPKTDEICEAVLESLTASGLAVSMSRSPERPIEIDKWRNLGVERMGLPIDAATRSIYDRVKGGSWEQAQAGLRAAALEFPGCVTTHLIIGLGETEEEAVGFLQAMAALDISVGLFAFTPIKGTPLAKAAQPGIGTYRRIQVVRFLLAQGYDNLDVRFQRGKIVDFGMSTSALARVLASGEAFMTSGCSYCNRPYYNEKPRGIMYNHPWSLSKEEVRECLEQMNE